MQGSLKWSDVFSVGHDGLDEDHRGLIIGVNNICEAYTMRKPRELVYAMLLALERETEKHLKHENEVMLEILANTNRSMPEELKAMASQHIKDHVAEHEKNLARLRTIMRASSPHAKDAAANLCMDLMQWFLDHAIKHDSHLKAILQAT